MKGTAVPLSTSKGKVFFFPDGTLAFDAWATQAFHLQGAKAISVYYSRPLARLVLQPMENGDRGVPLEKTQAGGVIAFRAADFLDHVEALPFTTEKFEAEYLTDVKLIVIPRLISRTPHSEVMIPW
jgi:hypothetical protein